MHSLGKKSSTKARGQTLPTHSNSPNHLKFKKKNRVFQLMNKKTRVPLTSELPICRVEKLKYIQNGNIVPPTHPPPIPFSWKTIQILSNLFGNVQLGKYFAKPQWGYGRGARKETLPPPKLLLRQVTVFCDANRFGWTNTDWWCTCSTVDGWIGRIEPFGAEIQTLDSGWMARWKLMIFYWIFVLLESYCEIEFAVIKFQKMVNWLKIGKK